MTGSRRSALSRLTTLLRVRFYRRVSIGVAGVYMLLFMVALRDVSRGGTGIRFLTADWRRMFERTGAFTFEPIAQLVLPGVTVLLSPGNLLVGMVVAVLVGLNLAVTVLAFREPAACRFNRSAGVLASLPALLAGSACCAPVIVLLLGLQLSAVLVSAFQVLIPASVILLLITLKLVLDRTDVERIEVEGEAFPSGDIRGSGTSNATL